MECNHELGRCWPFGDDMVLELKTVKYWYKQYDGNRLLDGRRGCATLFCYCPWCGEKINWKKIKDECKKSKVSTLPSKIQIPPSVL